MASWPEYHPTELLGRLSAADVDFVLIGGLAVVTQGYPRLTRDIDITYAPEQANLDSLGSVLVELNARLRGVAEDVPFVPDGATLRRTMILTLTTDLGALDLLGAPPGAPDYATLRRRADRVDVAGVRVLVASIEDLLAMKHAAGRPRDLDDIQALEAVLRLRR